MDTSRFIDRYKDNNFIDGLKDKLGFASPSDSQFARRKADYDSYDDGYDDGQDNYDDFDDYDEFDDAYADEFAEYGPSYNENSTRSYDDGYTTRETRRSYSSNHGIGYTNLVSIDDVRATTPPPTYNAPDSTLPPKLLPGGVPRLSYRGDRELVDSSLPEITSTPSAPNVPSSSARPGVSFSTAPANSTSLHASRPQARIHSEGLQSIFEPTEDDKVNTRPANSGLVSSSTSTRSASSFDPYEAYTSSAPMTITPRRSCEVIYPVVYSDVERVAKILRAGDVVVLSFDKTSDELAKRVLDFSFGVASALDARVEHPADAVFVIVCGQALSALEHKDLQAKGIL